MTHSSILLTLRTLAIAVVSLIAASIAHGQVAAPSLVPSTFVTENPAAMQWGTPSRVGFSYSQAQVVTNPTSSSDNFTGYGGGLRLVGSRFSFAAEGAHYDSSNKPYSVNESQDAAAGALAVRLGDSFSLGIGQQHFESKLWTPIASLLDQSQVDETTGGFTIRLGEWFFLGGAGGQDTVASKDVTNGSFSFSTSRDVYKYGAGIRTGGTVLTHFEYYIIDKSKFANSSLTGGRETNRTGIAELNLGGFLLAYSTTHTDRDSGFDTTNKDTADIGYAPYTGLTVTLHGEVTKDTHPTGSTYTSTTTTLTSLAITYLFGG